MSLLDFASNSLVVNIAIFAVAAVIVWLAGTRVSFYADSLAARTGIGSAFMGLLFLALATETPEIGTTVSAALSGNAPLAVNNAFGGVNLQTAILAIVDLLYVRGALTYFTPNPVLMIQGVFLILLLGLSLAATAAGDSITIAGVGVWSILLLVGYGVSVYVARRYEGREEWQPQNAPNEEQIQESVKAPESQTTEERFEGISTRRLIVFFIIGTGIILVAGFILARVGEALAEQSGLGASFIGATLLAASTSLPEFSASVAAVRLGNYGLAFANIFGSNSIMMLLIFIADVFYREGPLLQQVDSSAMFAAASGIVITAIYMIGMLERRDRTVLRMGIDSAIVLVVYLGSLVILYQLR